MIKKIWTDPVWSKVISVAIISLIVAVYSWIKSLTSEIHFWSSFKGIVFYGIPAIYILMTLIIYWLLKSIFKNKAKQDYYTIKEKELRQFNSIPDTKAGLLYKWQVFFDYGKPFISDFEIFCTKHGQVPIRLMDSRCSDYNCNNARLQIDYYAAKNHIESMVIHKWDEINKK